MLLLLFAMCSAFASALAERQLTILVYMCGSNLESGSGAASVDLDEMKAAVSSDRMTLLALTGGSVRWGNGLDADKLCVTQIESMGRNRVYTRFPSSDMGDPETLTAFISYAVENFPAKEYALIVWNHGTGPLEGVCLDELYYPDTLSLPEIGSAIDASGLGQKLKWIGFDACLMSTVEVANAIAPYARYMIASEETEPAAGWDYAFLNGMDPDEDGAETARRIIDLYMQTPHSEAEVLTLACTDLSRIDAVVRNMDDFFAPIGDRIDRNHFPMLSNLRLSAASFGRTVRGVGVDGYDLVDLKDLCAKYRSENDPQALIDAIDAAVCYMRSTSRDAGGLSVYHPYYNKAAFRDGWSQKYDRLSFCAGYARYVQRFGELLDGEALASWQGLDTVDNGLDQNNDNWFSLRLTPQQREAFSSAQLIALYPCVNMEGTGRFLETVGMQDYSSQYTSIYIDNASLDDDGSLTARYTGRALYVTDAMGNAVLGPLSYRLSPDGEKYYLCAEYSDTTGREDSEAAEQVLFVCRPDGEDGLAIATTQVYDPLTQTYTNRIALPTERYNRLVFKSLAAEMPTLASPMPGFDEWRTLLIDPGSKYYNDYSSAIDAGADWQLRFFDFQQSGLQTYAAFQITDTQQNTYMSELLPVRNPNLKRVEVLPQSIEADGFDVSCYMVRDISSIKPTIGVCLEFRYRGVEKDFYVTGVLLGDDPQARASRAAMFMSADRRVCLDGSYRVEPERVYLQIDVSSLTDLSAVRRLEIELNGGRDGARLVFFPEDCDVSDIAPVSDAPPLAEAVQNGVTLQLMKLERGQGDAIRGMLHAVNRSDETLDTRSVRGIILDDLCLEASFDRIEIRPDSDAYIGFTAEDGAFLSGKLSVAGRDNSRFLSVNQLIRRFIGDSVRRVKVLYASGFDIERAWQLDLATPVSLAGPVVDGDAPTAPEGLPILDGEISAEVERVLVADDGVGVRMVLRNSGDADRLVRIHNRLLNGISLDNQYSDTYVVAAHGVTVACLGIDTDYALDPGYALWEIGFTFGCGHRTSDLARITFDRPVMLGAMKGTYLSAGDMSTRPASLEIGSSVRLSKDRFEGDRFGMTVSVGLEDDGGFNALIGQVMKLGVTLSFENRSDMQVDAVTTPFVFNGDHETEESWICFDIAPHTTVIRTWHVDAQSLWGIGSVRSLRCDMEVRESSDYGWGDLIETIPIDLGLDGISLGHEGQRLEPLCQVEADGILWQLLSVEADGNGRLTGWLNAVNTTDNRRTFKNSAVLAEGVRGDDHVPEIELAAQGRQLIPFAFENEARLFSRTAMIPGTNGYATAQMDRLLQRLGIREVSRLTFALGLRSDLDDSQPKAPDQCVVFTLPEPLPLEEAGYEAPPSELLMRQEGVSAWLDSVIIGERGFSLGIRVENQSDRCLSLDCRNGYVDGEMRVLSKHDWYQTLLPHTVSYMCVLDSAMTPGSVMQSIRIPFGLNDGEGYDFDCGSALINLKALAELSAAGAIWLDNGDYDIEPADPGANRLSDMLQLPRADVVRPVTLVAPISEERARHFVRGEAMVCMETGFGYGYDEYDTVTWEHVRLELAPDASGRITAEYSGLILYWSDVPATVKERTRDGVSEFISTLYEFSNEYYNFELIPGDDPSQPPRLVPMDLPGDYEEGMAVDAGIRSTYRFVVQNDGEALTVLEQEVEHRRMSPDDPPELEDEYDGWDVYMAQDIFTNQHYDTPRWDWNECVIDTERNPGMSPLEGLVQDDEDDIRVRYHIWYDDGTDEVLVEDYPMQ